MHNAAAKTNNNGNEDEKPIYYCGWLAVARANRVAVIYGQHSIKRGLRCVLCCIVRNKKEQNVR